MFFDIRDFGVAMYRYNNLMKLLLEEEFNSLIQNAIYIQVIIMNSNFEISFKPYQIKNI